VEIIRISSPLVSWNLEELDAARETVKLLEDDSRLVELHVDVHSPEMIPTVLALSMSKRHNVTYHATLKTFRGWEYLYGYLLTSYFEKVEVDDG